MKLHFSIWTGKDDEDELIDEDALLTEEDLKAPELPGKLSKLTCFLVVLSLPRN